MTELKALLNSLNQKMFKNRINRFPEQIFINDGAVDDSKTDRLDIMLAALGLTQPCYFEAMGKQSHVSPSHHPPC